jgi:hypothetical protein
MTSALKKVTFFSPHAGIWPHALPESFLAKCLDSKAFTVSRITCNGTFSNHCTVMEALGISVTQEQSSKDLICKRCTKNSNLLSGAYAGSDYVISNYLDDDDVAHVSGIASDLTESNIEELIHLGVEVGRIAAYEPLIKFKKASLDFNDEEWVYFHAYIRNALLSLIAFSRIIDKVQPDIVITYSPQYAVLGVCARYCELKGIKVYFIEGSSNIAERYAALRVWDWSVFGLTNPALRYWFDIDSYAISEGDYERVNKHVSQLLNGSSFSVYSEPATGQFIMRAHFGIPPHAKVVLAAMSSYDEVYSAYFIGRFPSSKFNSNVFSDQIEWIEATINFFSNHPELFLIIRVHPRTFPSKRNNVMAREQIVLKTILTNLPANVRVNLPTDMISIYDLYPEIDVLVTGWSATAVEAMLYDVSVVTYDRNLPSYPSSIHHTGSSKLEYFTNLMKAVRSSKTKVVSEAGLRWLAFSMSIGVVRHPVMLHDLDVVRNSRVGNFIYRACNHIFPDLIRRIELSQRMRVLDARRFNALLKTGQTSLYDIPRDTSE